MTHEFRLPDLGEGLTEADIIEWFVKVGDDVDVDQAIVEIETAKTAVEISATHAGTVSALGGLPGDTVAVGDVLFVIGGSSRQHAADSPRQEESRQHEDLEREPSTVDRRRPTAGGGIHVEEAQRVRAMPIVRKLAKERGIDLSSVKGTGPGGAVTRADLANEASGDHRPELVPMNRRRRAIAHHMSESWATIPHVTVQADVRAEQILRTRERGAKGPIPVEAIVAHAIAPLLLRYREFNAVVRGDSIEYRRSVHLGIAVDTADGLMVAVVRDADRLSLEELAGEIRRLARAAQDGTLLPAEAVGQTFTISNIGALGGGHGTPIIPLGTSAILSIGRAHSTAIVVNGSLGVGLVAPVDLSYDHRLIDGSLGQEFLTSLVDSLESADSSGEEGTL